MRYDGLVGKVNFVFDRQNEYEPHATALYRRAIQQAQPPEFRNQLGGLTFKDKTGVAGLQAADLFAHAAYKRSGRLVGINEELDLVTLRLRGKHIAESSTSTMRRFGGG